MGSTTFKIMYNTCSIASFLQKLLYIYLGFGELRIKASSLVELHDLRLNNSSIHLGIWWVKNKSFLYYGTSLVL